jgi:peptidoglycan/xylan/chitin deacetylase (PgdA/CDA1 family)
MYHRIAAPVLDPWGLAVHPDRFEAHLDVLERRTVLSVREIVRRFERGTLPDEAVAITFDDGYADNLLEALPRLQAKSMPATLFLAAGAIGRDEEFWWDELARATLDHEDATWRAWEEPRTDRQRTYIDLWRRLRDQSAAGREASMERLREALRPPRPDPRDMPMSTAQVEQMTRSGLVEIGGHTLTHAMLPSLAPAERRREIAEGRKRCEEVSRQRITGFAYPHGAFDDDCRAAVRESGFSWACGTMAAPLTSTSDLFALPRFAVPDADAEGFERMLA